ncbi:uncharacterized protein [Elaeis guineensis]|uniref:Uncharacterized protein LOC105056675 isoform X2 n=1 Tax=Elaeis guineensis var. tenera TaxID=51953 RepID=A0A6I9S3V4_ELAGV|nr:uncharacterized protein LOC105056675 isoform X2 [Elaeis guineensis]
MERFKNSQHLHYDSMETRNERLGPASQRFMQGPSSSANTNPRPSANTNPRPPESIVSYGVGHVLNYSFQTGEEFALEFMRERANPRRPPVPSTSVNQIIGTGYVDQRVIIGLPPLGPQRVSDDPVLATEHKVQSKEKEKKVFFETKNKGDRGLVRSVSHSLSDGGNGRRFHHGYPSEVSNISSTKMKFVCSFGGKFLPRPSDGKLRYVGGETRMFRISKGISWQEFMQKTKAMYSQTHTIKYQLPGEDFDALVSVSCDEDLQNMFEECSILHKGDGSQKTRIFLFSSDDHDDIHFSLGNMEGDSEIQYLVAVNDLKGSGEVLSLSGFPSTLGSDLFQLLNTEVEEVKKNSATPVNTPSFPIQSSLSASFDNPQHRDHEMQNAEGDGNPYSASHHLDYSKHDRISISSSTPDSGSNVHYAPSGETSVPKPIHELVPVHQGVVEGLYRDTRSQAEDVSVKEVDSAVNGLAHRKNEIKEIQHVASKCSAPTLQNDGPVSNFMHVDVSCGSSAPECVASSKCHAKHVNTKQVVPPPDTLTSGQNSAPKEDDSRCTSAGDFASGFSDYEANVTGLSYADPASSSLRIFRTELIPREQAELLVRLSKSDDSVGFQQLALHPHTSVTQESFKETVKPLPDANPVSQSEKFPLAAKPPAAELATIMDDVTQIKMCEILADTDNQMSKFKPLAATEKSETSRVFCKPVSSNTFSTKQNRHDPEKAAVNQVSCKYAAHGQTDDISNEENYRKSYSTGRKIEISDQDPMPLRLVGDKNVMNKDKIWYDSDRSRNSENSTVVSETGVVKSHFKESTIEGGEAAEVKCLSACREDDTGVGLKMQNHEDLSFQRNLAQDKSGNKDVSLFNQDIISHRSLHTRTEAGFSSAHHSAPLKDDVTKSHKNSQVDCNEKKQRESSGPHEQDANMLYPNDIPSDVTQTQLPDKSGDALQAGNPLAEVGNNLGTLISDCEELKPEIGPAAVPVNDASLKDFVPSRLQIIKNEDLEELRELGSGTFGTVYHGKWRGSDVAIKRIKNSCFTDKSSPNRLTSEFWREACILSKLHHPNVVAFYGVVQDGPGGTLATVTEFMVNGSLKHVLLRKDKYLDLRKRLILSMDAAIGMEYLHSKNIVHFDLKCDNLLVNLKDPSRPICKVGDFGLSKMKRNTMVSGGMRGTLPWMAPELLTISSNKVSEKVDVYSFGIVMWEILTGEEPYADMHYGAVIGGILNNTLRPPVPNSCDPDWRRLMEQCWAPDPEQRPSFTQIASRLRSMYVANQTRSSS